MGEWTTRELLLLQLTQYFYYPDSHYSLPILFCFSSKIDQQCKGLIFYSSFYNVKWLIVRFIPLQNISRLLCLLVDMPADINPYISPNCLYHTYSHAHTYIWLSSLLLKKFVTNSHSAEFSSILFYSPFNPSI